MWEVNMKSLLKIWLKIFPLIILNNSLSFSQSFDKNILIDIPGDNYDFDLHASEKYPGAESFITWINKNDSIYTVFLKRISPEIGDNLVVSSDLEIKSNPKISRNRYAKGVKIIWQNYINDYYKIMGCNYLNDSLSSKIIIQDSIDSNPQISLSIHRIIWIDRGKLFEKEFYPSLSNPIIIDSLNCSSPNVINNDNISNTQILYEKVENENHNIYLAEYNAHTIPQWNYKIIANGSNRNPNFGIDDGISFETIENQFSKVKYSAYGAGNWMITNNEICNYKNPEVFSYPVTTGSTNNKTPFFVAFDTDSIKNDSEIFIKTFYFGIYDSLINISKMEGNDYQPKVGYILNNDTVYVSIIWLHQTDSKIDIWMAKEVFKPIISSVRNEHLDINSFYLMQNYPNPFNPSTTIEYEIPNSSNVKIEIFDVLGRKIETLMNKEQIPGNYKIYFDGSKFSSGIYFYRITAGNFIQTKKMILIK
jgi:hypothetical protein